MPWTTEQRDAITASGNLIVSAAAGAGKTAVLTERIVTRIIGGMDVSNMLVLTFTRAAAAEMKTRISKRLTALAEETDDRDARLMLLSQARAVGGAHISTVHAFCVRVLRRHYHALGLAPDSRVADETEAAVIAEEVKDTLLNAFGAEENPSWRRLLAAFGSEDAAWGAVAGTVRFIAAEPEGTGWLKRVTDAYTAPEGVDGLLGSVVDTCKEELTLALSALSEERDKLPPDRMENVFAVLDDALMRGRALLLSESYDAFRQGLFEMEYGRLVFPRGTDEECKAPVRDARDAVKELVKLMQKILSRPYDAECAMMRDAGVILLALADVVEAYTAAFTESKRARNVFDFSDLEHLALSALRQPDIAAEYREKFALIAVDEYQDSNRVQEAIVDAIRREDNLFFVGDVKQSIYRFRQAEPALFLDKLKHFTGQAGRRIDLSHNFRSSEEVLTAVNDTFEAIMRPEAAELDYDERAHLRAGTAHAEGGAELHIISRETAMPDESLEPAADAEVEARLAADRIHTLITTMRVPDEMTGEPRALTYGDIAILLRSTTHAQRIAETLSQCGVPCYAQLNGGYFDAIEVQVFLNLLRVIDNRRQDVPLISVMLSGIGGFTAQQLATIRIGHRAGTFFDAVEAAADSDAQVAVFLNKIARWHGESLLLSVEELIGLLLDETGFAVEMGASVGGLQRQANLNALFDKAHAFENGGARGLPAFLNHMDLARSNASIGAAQTAGADVVRILTIHKSKGLEFPVVIALQLGSRFNLRSDSDGIILHSRRGAAIKFLEPGERIYHDTAVRQSILRLARREQLAEEMRVLYVAMTRAKSRLILVGCMHAPEEKLARASIRPAPYTTLSASCPLLWLLSGKRSAMPVTLHNRAKWASVTESAKDAPALPEADPALLAALSVRFSFRYAFASSVALPSKASVSRIARADAVLPLSPAEGETLGAFYTRLPDFHEPAFLQGDRPSPAFIGTATHTVLQHLPLSAALPRNELPDYLHKLTGRQLITQKQADSVPLDTIDWWQQTALCERMRRSVRVERELSFAYAVDASRLFSTDAQERILLQGVIDCCFIENGGWTLLDYKTDRVPPGTLPREVAERHMAQLSLYADALASLTGLPVSERYVILLSAREIVSL